jgi:acyl-coenzyme A thioesterase PaaI-like protein
VATPKKIGKSIHVWDIEISDEQGDLIATAKLTSLIKWNKEA